ncbi:MAG: Lrp/AsnC ligand binding domain-containing protein [Methanotrichaceae archaeon]|nr:Lrp/AsnC ligand binding domain-containing protein [Methanotrichaceae archaeon]
MVIAVALIKVVPGKEKPVYHALKNMGVTKSLYHIFGDHDFLIILDAESKGELAMIVEQIREIEGVAAADTVLMGKEGCLEERRYLQAPVLSAELV